MNFFKDVMNKKSGEKIMCIAIPAYYKSLKCT